MNGSYLGPNFSDEFIKESLDKIGAKYRKYKKTDVTKYIAKKLSKGNAVGWFQGRMEFGPRALGGRSILADPRNENMQKQLNLKIKFRESFRPFAPAVLEKYCASWFNLNSKSPYMLFVADINEKKVIKKKTIQQSLSIINQKRSVIPGVTHVDYSARIQTVSKSLNKLFFELLNEFYKLTKTPILINTSFNIRGEPIVCTPTDAFKCFMGTKLDFLVIENFVLDKKRQNKKLLKNYKQKFDLD